MIRFKHSGNFNKTERFLQNSKSSNYLHLLNKYGKEGVDALSLATPKESGETANSWDYKISTSNKRTTLSWTNSNIIEGAPIAILIQYGHATMNGGYVQGLDYINPAIKPIFEKLSNELWKGVIGQ